MSTSEPRASLTSNATPFQNSTYAGVSIQNVLYGIELVLFFETMRALFSKSRKACKKTNIFYALFSGMMLFSVSVWVITSAIFCQKMWLKYSDYPGGADAYFLMYISVWYMDWGTTGVIVLQLMTDALMIYRCRIIWGSYRVIILPIFLWLSTLVLGIFVDWTSSAPGGNFFAGVASQLGLAYYTTSVFLNVLLTCMICYHLVRHGRRVREQLGPGPASFYFSVVTLVVESMLPYTLSGVAFLVALGTGSATSPAFLAVYVFLMCISPQMLILRVLLGRAWDKDISLTAASTIRFNPSLTVDSEEAESDEARIHLETSKVYLSDGDHSEKIEISQV